MNEMLKNIISPKLWMALFATASFMLAPAFGHASETDPKGEQTKVEQMEKKEAKKAEMKAHKEEMKAEKAEMKAHKEEMKAKKTEMKAHQEEMKAKETEKEKEGKPEDN